MTDDIEKTIELNAPVERVWRAISDAREFGQWFGVTLEKPFEAGRPARGRITSTGYEHLVMTMGVVRIEPPRLFAFTWHPYAVDPATDYSGETPTRVEFRLEPTASGGTRLTVRESGFEALPPHRRDEAWRMNTRGWAIQMDNIAAHVG